MKTSKTKADMKQGLKGRRKSALDILKKQWKECYWTRPLGHVQDGKPRCLYCGHFTWSSLDSVEELERQVAKAQDYPIAKQEPKIRIAS